MPTGSRRLSSTPEASATARRLVRELARARLPGPAVQDAVLLTSELVTNAVRHGPGEEIRVHVSVDEEGVVVVVSDRGRGFDPGAPRIDGHAGRWGLELVEALATDWGVASRAGGTDVWFEIEPGGTGASTAPARGPDGARSSG